MHRWGTTGPVCYQHGYDDCRCLKRENRYRHDDCRCLKRENRYRYDHCRYLKRDSRYRHHGLCRYQSNAEGAACTVTGRSTAQPCSSRSASGVPHHPHPHPHPASLCCGHHCPAFQVPLHAWSTAVLWCDLADQCHATTGQCHAGPVPRWASATPGQCPASAHPGQCHAGPVPRGPVPLPRRAGSGARASAGRMGLGDRFCRGAAGGQLRWYTLAHICPRLRSPRPHLPKTAVTPPTSAPGLRSPLRTGLGPHTGTSGGVGPSAVAVRGRARFCCFAAMHSHSSSPLRVSWADGFGAVRRPPESNAARNAHRTARRDCAG